MKLPPLRDILEHARHAPSGDNMQPWQFKTVDTHTIELFYSPPNVAEPSFFRVGIFTSMGIILEYVSLVSASYGYTVHSKLNPSFTPEHDRRVTTLTFVESTIPVTEDVTMLVSAIKRRSTLRTKYEKTPLPEAAKQALESSLAACKASVTWVESEDARHKASSVMSAWDSFFWSTTKNTQSLALGIFNKTFNPTQTFGMPVTTLGIGPLAPLMLPIFRLAQRIPPLLKPIAKSAKQATIEQIRHSAALGFLYVPKSNDVESWSDHIQGGRATARLWLCAASQGLAFQPLFPFVVLTTNQGDFDRGHTFNIARTSAENFLTEIVLNNQNKVLVFAFRIGISRNLPPENETPRKPVEQILSLN